MEVAEKLPHALPLQEAPLAVQVTPAASSVVAVRATLSVVVRAARLGETATLRVAAETVIVRLIDLLWAGVPESVTVKVTWLEPAGSPGVPLTVPDAAFRVSPGGRAPLVMVQVYGAVPPETASVALYAVPICALGRLAEVIVSGAGTAAAMVSVRFADWL